MKVKVRSYTEADLPFIYNSWLKNCRPDYVTIPPDKYFKWMKGIIETLILESEITVACDPEDERVIYSYLVHQRGDGERPTLHFAYTKGNLRRFGLFRFLLSTLNWNASYDVSYYPKRKHAFLKKFPFKEISNEAKV